MLVSVGLVVVAYLFGAIPTGYLLARARGIDIRAVGSGNIGATNVTRSIGKALGAVTLVGDLAKGLIPVVVARWAGLDAAGQSAVALAAFLGHVFPVYLGFRGGKGVATAFGVILGLQPAVALLAAGVWVAFFAIWRYASVGSLGAAVAFPAGMWWFRPDRYSVSLAAVVAFVIYVRHRENIRRLLDGTEGKVSVRPGGSTPGA